MKSCKKILVYGYGNPGRGDDALGPSAAAWCEKETACGRLLSVGTDCNYQLNIEDALLISEYDTVIFADASLEDIDDFSFSKVIKEKSIAFSTHSMSPSSVLALCFELYDKVPDTYILSIRGYRWELGGGISRGAEENLNKALAFLKTALADPNCIASMLTD